MAVRSTSEERREQVIAAAVKEFAEKGFHATSTGAIAKRAGISQPYIYALFPNKHELFLAAHRDEILVQMQAHAAAGDPALREPVRQEFLGLIEEVRRMSGASQEQAM